MNTPRIVGRRNLQLLALPGGAPGSAGFKLTGTSADGGGLCRVWLRRKDPWERYLDPRFRSDVWDVRCYTHVDSAFALIEEFSPATLDELAERYSFDADPAELARLGRNGDSVHDTVLAWAKRVLGAPDDPAVEPARGPSPVAPDRHEVPVRADFPKPDALAVAVEAAPVSKEPGTAVAASAAPATAEAVEAPAASPESQAQVTGAEAPGVSADVETAMPAITGDTPGGSHTMALPGITAPLPDAQADAWDELAEVARKASTGSRPAVE